jgi:integrator complex subunit 11
MDLTEFLSPKHVILVHGEKPQMAFLKERIESELGMPCYFPGNNESVSIPTTQNLKMSATERFITSCAVEQGKRSLCKRNLICGTSLSEVIGSDKEAAEGVLLMEKYKSPKILCEDELLEVLGMERHLVQFEPMVSGIVATVESELQRAKAADLDSDGK